MPVLVTQQDIIEMKGQFDSNKKRSLEDFFEESIKKLESKQGAEHDLKLEGQWSKLERAMGTKAFNELQALEKERYDALAALERGNGDKLWNQYIANRDAILNSVEIFVDQSEWSPGKGVIQKDSEGKTTKTVRDLISDVDDKLKAYAETGFENANGQAVAKLLTFNVNVKLTFAQWFKALFTPLISNKGKIETSEFKAPQGENKQSLQEVAVEIATPVKSEKVDAPKQTSDAEIAQKLQQEQQDLMLAQRLQQQEEQERAQERKAQEVHNLAIAKILQDEIDLRNPHVSSDDFRAAQDLQDQFDAEDKALRQQQIEIDRQIAIAEQLKEYNLSKGESAEGGIFEKEKTYKGHNAEKRAGGLQGKESPSLRNDAEPTYRKLKR